MFKRKGAHRRPLRFSKRQNRPAQLKRERRTSLYGYHDHTGAWVRVESASEFHDVARYAAETGLGWPQ